ncbi:MAG: adenosylmethionine--8-amino-7-oxononanoate transaminase [Proteobacteria bacterium]|nr:MAG: adenosylmethionine--8-amino-7-oxononanoate transaminase [Pseudomonadota bacterium]
MDRERVVALDKARVWHPYTSMDEYAQGVDPIVVVRAEGPWLHDADGRAYLDANSSWWVASLGHNHPRLVAALARQARDNCHSALAGMTHPPAAELAEALCGVAPRGGPDGGGLEHVFFSDDGSTAVEVALKLSVQYWAQNGRPARTRFAALGEAFHGETIGATALGGVELFRRPFRGVLAECFHLPSPGDPSVSAERALEALERLLAREADTIACVVVEPMVQGAAGMWMHDAAYLRAARALCTRHDVFFVADEVFTGYGRTGPMWACQHAGVAPDLLCTAKGFSGGMLPMAATLATRRIHDGFLGGRERAFYYGHSFCGNPLGAAVALEVLRVYDEERVLERAAPKAARIAEAFAKMASLRGVARTRSLGMIGALDLAGDAGYLAGAGWRVYDEARRRGAYLRPLGNVIYVAPPLNIPDADLERLLAIVAESVAAVAGA